MDKAFQILFQFTDMVDEIFNAFCNLAVNKYWNHNSTLCSTFRLNISKGEKILNEVDNLVFKLVIIVPI